MSTMRFERRLLALYRQALRQRQWPVAEQLLAAIEACAPEEPQAGDAVCQAWLAVDVEAAGSKRRPGVARRAKFDA